MAHGLAGLLEVRQVQQLAGREGGREGSGHETGRLPSPASMQPTYPVDICRTVFAPLPT